MPMAMSRSNAVPSSLPGLTEIPDTPEFEDVFDGLIPLLSNSDLQANLRPY